LSLPDTQGWRVGIVAPEDFYLRDLARTRQRVLAVSLAVIALILAGGTVALRPGRHGLGQVGEATGRREDFEFPAAPARSSFADVEAVLMRLEVAKTAMRALGLYVPTDLVRLLYKTGREPVLGGELAEVTIMFSDIAGFTTIAERLPPTELARVLGRYL